jgi:hypothetical protein
MSDCENNRRNPSYIESRLHFGRGNFVYYSQYLARKGRFADNLCLSLLFANYYVNRIKKTYFKLEEKYITLGVHHASSLLKLVHLIL